MLTIRLTAVLFTAICCSSAVAQVRPRPAIQANIRPQADPLAGPSPMEGNTLREYASSGYQSAPSSFEQSCNQSRRQQMAAVYQARRSTEQSRREASRKSIPLKQWSDEERAASKFVLAHMLWTAGKIDASRMQLAKLLDEFPRTQTADRARLTLARL